jgi:4-hydroxythreonine-4-phosphate dehydrogenase
MGRFIFTCGDINGIGPEIVIKALNRLVLKGSNESFIFICPQNIFHITSELVSPLFKYEILKKNDDIGNEQVSVVDIGNFNNKPGKPTADSGKAAFKAIRLSYKLVRAKKADAIITAPISKSALKKAGINYPGHTEIYADFSGTNNYMMMFLSKKMNAGLVTIHHPVKDVSKIITRKLIRKKIELSIKTLEKDLRIKEPAIAVLGLNPHAGENGYIGTEEEKIIKPALKIFNDRIKGPFPPDAFFANKLYRDFDLILGMYHDQVLIPFKMMNFHSGTNFTAGLNIIRTSPDHGTAFDIAGKNAADESSILEAFNYARIIFKNRKSEK